jgi:SnoaL-like domain
VIPNPELGAKFAAALGAKDFERVAELLHPEVRLRGLTPRRSWEAVGPEAAIDEVLATWFDDSRQIDEVLSIEAGGFADRGQVTYSFRGTRPEGPFVVEQRAYFTERDGRIDWMHVLCSGLRPTG